MSGSAVDLDNHAGIRHVDESKGTESLRLAARGGAEGRRGWIHWCATACPPMMQCKPDRLDATPGHEIIVFNSLYHLLTASCVTVGIESFHTNVLRGGKGSGGPGWGTEDRQSIAVPSSTARSVVVLTLRGRKHETGSADQSNTQADPQDLGVWMSDREISQTISATCHH